MAELPDADELHRRFFGRWNRPADRERPEPRALRPDLLQVPGFREVAPKELSPLKAERQASVLEMVEKMVAAARVDWAPLVAPHDVLSRDGLLALDASLDDERLRALLDASDPEDLGNDWFVTACELGAVLGATLEAARTSLHWVADWPYWESTLVERRTGHVVAPFHWAIRRLSAGCPNTGLVEKIGWCLGLLDEATRAAKVARP